MNKLKELFEYGILVIIVGCLIPFILAILCLGKVVSVLLDKLPNETELNYYSLIG